MSIPTKKPALESEIGPLVIAWLQGHGFEVYQEVDAWAGIADLVGVCGPMVGVVEMKLQLSWELLSQAMRWCGVAHQVWVAVPAGKRSDGRRTAEMVFGHEGIGVLSVNFAWSEPRVDLVARPAFNRRAEVRHIRDKLREQQKTFAAAGAQGGRRWTDFRNTCDLLRRHVLEHPGVTMREAVAAVKHHYASDAGACGRLVALIEKGVVEGVRIERDGRTPRLHPAGPAA